MGLLSRAQEIYGKKVFREDVEFEGKLIAKNGMEVYAEPQKNELSLGTLHMYANPSSWSLVNSGTATTWTDVSCSSRVPGGTKAVLLQCSVEFTYASGLGYCNMMLRKNGSTLTAEGSTPQIGFNVAAGAGIWGQKGILIVEIDSQAKFEYCIFLSGGGTQHAYIGLLGYFL